MRLKILPLTPDLWSDFEDLFGEHGAFGGCWCMYWRIGSAFAGRPHDLNKREFHEIVKRGPPPGLLAFDGDLAVGWCQITPRSSLPRLDKRRFTKAVDNLPVWSVSCFYVRVGYRRRGVMTALIDAAVKSARRAKAPALEAYPVDTAEPKSSSSIYTGTAAAFLRAGFKPVARRVPHRPVMRHDLKSKRA